MQIEWKPEEYLRHQFISNLLDEVSKAEKKFPLFPTDPIHMTSIMVEEAGESMQAALDLFYGREECVDNLMAELIQTAAMCYRAWTLLHEQGDGNKPIILYEPEATTDD